MDATVSPPMSQLGPRPLAFSLAGPALAAFVGRGWPRQGGPWGVSLTELTGRGRFSGGQAELPGSGPPYPGSLRHCGVPPGQAGPLLFHVGVREKGGPTRTKAPPCDAGRMESSQK